MKNLANSIVWSLAMIVASCVLTARAHAHPFMISHGYTQCAACHSDPSGGGLLTEYGRAQGGLLLAQRWDGQRTEADDELAAARGAFLFGAVKLPEELLLGGDVRGAVLGRSASGQPLDARFILMTADVGAAVQLDRFHAQGTLGFATDG